MFIEIQTQSGTKLINAAFIERIVLSDTRTEIAIDNEIMVIDAKSYHELKARLDKAGLVVK